MKKIGQKILVLLLLVSLVVPGVDATAFAADTSSTKTIQILATSDLHGKFLPYDYALDTESASGSMAQIATLVKEYRAKNADTIVVDAGDTIQDNSSALFINCSLFDR